MRRTIFRSFSIIAVVTALVMALSLAAVMSSNIAELIQTQTINEGRFLALSLEQGIPDSFLDEAGRIMPSSRITLIAADGSIIYDNWAVAEEMENHLDREEVQEAMRNGSGTARRFSGTTGSETFYYAQSLENGMILRTSITVNIIQRTLMEIVPWFVFIALYAVCVSILLSSYQTKRIIDPINALDLENPLSNPAYDELAPFLVRMNEQNLLIQENMHQINQQQDEFMEITENMQEGLVVLGNKSQILTINRSAAILFEVKPEEVRGKSLLSIHRSPMLLQIISRAFEGNNGECVMEAKERSYQALANPVWDEDAVKGVILLLFDMTERRQAEAMRREFTANVSHELKTPLTAISGYCELMLSGLIKEDDGQEFLRRISDETRRMIALVENIMKLSRLDEWGIYGASMRSSEDSASDGPFDQIVDLYATAVDAGNPVMTKAADMQVTITFQGEECLVNGNPVLLDEMMMNLIDNAVKYNKVGGKVEVSIERGQEEARLIVKDTGCGIDKRYLGRIFERFYRIDQSRSREIEGSGLGLAIVKHIVQLHHGEINVESQVEVGTSIIVTLPVMQLPSSANVPSRMHPSIDI